MLTRHEITSHAKVVALVSSIETNGWQGPPLVADGEMLITGVHRSAALRALGWSRAAIDEVTVDIRDIFAANGLDYEAIRAEEEADFSDFEVSLPWVINHLPQSVLDEYGIEVG
jgi:ParB-like chromosome segregation protein Spo0J